MKDTQKIRAKCHGCEKTTYLALLPRDPGHPWGLLPAGWWTRYQGGTHWYEMNLSNIWGGVVYCPDCVPPGEGMSFCPACGARMAFSKFDMSSSVWFCEGQEGSECCLTAECEKARRAVGGING